LIAKQVSKRKAAEETGHDGFTVDLLMDAVFGERKRQRGLLGLHLLYELGLLRGNGTDGWAATSRLQQLFCDGYYMQDTPID
jgi:hypothetical protein